MSKYFRLMGVILATTMMLTLVVGVVGSQDEVVLVVGIEQEHARQRPLNSMSWSGYIESVYGRDLWEWNIERVAEPIMAEVMPSIEDGTVGSTEDGNTWVEVTLREGIQWSDGMPITTADCEAWHNVRFDRETTPNISRDSYPDIVESFEAIDERTFRLTYNQPFPDVLVADERPQCLYPAHILNPPLEAGGIIDDSPYWDMTENESVAFGPFKVVARERGASWTLVKNEYWPEVFTQPAIDRIVLVLIEDDTQMRNAMRVGDIDMYFNWSEDAIPELQAMEGVEIWNTPGVYADALWIRMGENVDEPTPARASLQDIRVRQAIVHALDREFLVENIVGPGIAVPKSWYPRQLWPEDLGYLVYDQGGARALLDEAGWMDHDGDEGSAETPSLRQNADGDELAGLRITTTQNEVRNNYQLVIQDMLAQVGIGIDIVIVPATIHFANFDEDGTLTAYHWDLSIFANSADALSPLADPVSYYCEYIPTAESPEGFNPWQFCNEDFEAADAAVGATFPGAERDGYVAEAVTIFTETAFWNGLRDRPTWYALNTDRWDLESFQDLGTLAINYLNNSEDWKPAGE